MGAHINTSLPSKRVRLKENPHPFGWWFADCPRHGRTPHLDLFGGLCERCVAEKQPAWETRRTRQ